MSDTRRMSDAERLRDSWAETEALIAAEDDLQRRAELMRDLILDMARNANPIGAKRIDADLDALLAAHPELENPFEGEFGKRVFLESFRKHQR